MPYRVAHVPQIGSEVFYVQVYDRATAKLIRDTLADYDLFQLQHKIKPDYTNMSWIEVFRDGDWLDLDDQEEDDER